MPNSRQLAEAIIEKLKAEEMPKIKAADFDEQAGEIILQLDLPRPVMDVRIEVPKELQNGSE